MKFARKIRLKVDDRTAAILDGQSRIVNWLYNHLLDHANELRSAYVKTQDNKVALVLYTKRGLRDLIPELKKKYPYLKSVYSSPLKNGVLRLSEAIGKYQKARKTKKPSKKARWPKFRRWQRRFFSLLYDEPWKGYSIEGRKLTLKLGMNERGERLSVCASLTESLPDNIGEVKQLRITKEAGQYYAIFTIDKEVGKKKKLRVSKAVAFDPNHDNFAYGVGVDGQAVEIENLAPLKPLEKRIDILKSRRDRCQRRSKLVKSIREDGSVHKYWKPSRRYVYFDNMLQKAHIKRQDQTKTYMYTVANKICREYDIIGIGDYTPQGGGLNRGMRRSMNNQSLIGKFKKVLAWTGIKSGKTIVVYGERGTTRTCHIPCCGYRVPESIDPGIRTWICPRCGTFHIRDENAAQNGLVRTLEKLKLPRSGHTPVDVQVRWVWRVTPSGVKKLRRGVDSSKLNTAKKLKQMRGSI